MKILQKRYKTSGEDSGPNASWDLYTLKSGNSYFLGILHDSSVDLLDLRSEFILKAPLKHSSYSSKTLPLSSLHLSSLATLRPVAVAAFPPAPGAAGASAPSLERTLDVQVKEASGQVELAKPVKTRGEPAAVK